MRTVRGAPPKRIGAEVGGSNKWAPLFEADQLQSLSFILCVVGADPRPRVGNAPPGRRARSGGASWSAVGRVELSRSQCSYLNLGAQRLGRRNGVAGAALPPCSTASAPPRRRSPWTRRRQRNSTWSMRRSPLTWTAPSPRRTLTLSTCASAQVGVRAASRARTAAADARSMNAVRAGTH
jgi:hypothetical protein